MDPFVFAAVLLAAACHAGWNAVLKLRLDPFRTIALIAIASAVVALPFLPFVGLPPAAAWPWVIASVVLHLGYYIGLTEAYRTGDMGQVYPIARGSAPLMTAAMSTTFLGERLGLIGWSGILDAGRRRFPDLSARRARSRTARPPRGRFRLLHRGDDLRLFAGGWHRRARRPAARIPIR